MRSCQNYGPLLGTLNTRCHIILGAQKGTIILTTAHISRLSGPVTILRLMDKILHDPRNYGIFLIMGHAGFCPSTVCKAFGLF